MFIVHFGARWADRWRSRPIRQRKPRRPDLRAPWWVLWVLILATVVAVAYATWITFGGCACR